MIINIVYFLWDSSHAGDILLVKSRSGGYNVATKMKGVFLYVKQFVCILPDSGYHLPGGDSAEFILSLLR